MTRQLNNVKPLYRTKGDTAPTLLFQLAVDNQPFDLTGYTLTYSAVNVATDAEYVAETSDNIEANDSENGIAEIELAVLTATVGKYAIFIFADDGSGDRRSFPADGRRLVLHVVDAPIAE